MKAEERKRRLFEAHDRERIERTNAIMARYLAEEISKNAARQEMREMRKVLLLKLRKEHSHAIR